METIHTGAAAITFPTTLCDYYQRREETEQTRRALVDAVGDEVDVDSYGVAMECQGFVNGFKLALGLCMGVCCCG